MINDSHDYQGWNEQLEWSTVSDLLGHARHQHEILDPGAAAKKYGKKVSDAVIFGPRFCEIFRSFNATLPNPIDPDRHLMALCTEYIVPFVKWVRQSEAQIQWISDMLLGYDYLRPEVRNGIIMVLVYTFASIKATRKENADMFITLQDKDDGLAIANRFSLKIYNDRFNYLSFLKTSLSSLIDAGLIPKNERLNQPRKIKQTIQNKEEIAAFGQLQQWLVAFLDKRDNIGARNFAAHITSHWQLISKTMRNRKFISALQSLAHIPLSSFSVPSTASASHVGLANTALLHAINASYAPTGAAMGGSASTRPPEKAAAAPSTTDPKEGSRKRRLGSIEPENAISSQSDEDDDEEQSVDSPKRKTLPPPAAFPSEAGSLHRSKHPRSHLSHDSSFGSLPAAPSSSSKTVQISTRTPQPAFCALRFEKMGAMEWDVKETRWFNLDAFVESLTTAASTPLSRGNSAHSSDVVLCFVDETMLSEELSNMKLTCQSYSANHGSLVKELQHRKALITTWPHRELNQFQSFVHCWQEQYKQPPAAHGQNASHHTLYSLWHSLHPKRDHGAHAWNRSGPTAHPTSFSAASSISSTSSLASSHAAATKDSARGAPSTRPASAAEANSSSHSDKLAHSSHSAAKDMRNGDRIDAEEEHSSLEVTRGGSGQYARAEKIGFVAYEVLLTIGVIIRANPHLKISEDIWCSIYPNELLPEGPQQCMSDFFINLFPQLRSGFASVNAEQIAIKYFAHKPHSSANPSSRQEDTDTGGLPSRPKAQAYQTIGTLSSTVVKVVGRMAGSVLFHDFVLDVL